MGDFCSRTLHLLQITLSFRRDFIRLQGVCSTVPDIGNLCCREEELREDSRIFVLVISTGISIFSNGSISQPPQTLLAQQQLPSNLTSAEQQLLTEGNSFEIDNVTFSHHTTTVNGIQLHYVMGGKGDPAVLLHGWPETWYEWHKVMPSLAKNYTVVVPDLRDLGDSGNSKKGRGGSRSN